MDEPLLAAETDRLPIWRRIEAALRREILAGDLPPGARLPTERQIAERFAANRMTARRALAALQQEGLIRIRQGDGTFVTGDVVDYRLGERVRFTEILAASDLHPTRRLISVETKPADITVARLLGVDEGTELLFLLTVGEADGRPISCGRNFYEAGRFRGLDAVFRETLSYTAALNSFGIEDYRRQASEVIARMPDEEEARLLRQARTRPVLGVESLDVDMAGRPIRYSASCFAGDRVRFVIGESLRRPSG